MKTRLNLIVLAFLVVISVLLWMTLKHRGGAMPQIAAIAPADKSATPPNVRDQSLPSMPLSETQTPTLPQASIDVKELARENSPRTDTPPAGDASAIKSTYTAKPGDTVSTLAAELPGGNRKINRDAVINANPSLQRDPDLVLAGKTYQIPATADAPVVVAPETVPERRPIADAVADEVVHELKYTARAGDNVSTLAAALLGSDTKDNRDAIIDANVSLRSDPDRVIIGQTYRIPVHASQPLAAAPAPASPTSPRPTTQPDADTVVKAASPRELRYTAQPGDTVATLATALLGSDTTENRAAITTSNESLKQDPDHVVAGKTYWIAAPAPQP